jgi:hypothetical protein
VVVPPQAVSMRGSASNKVPASINIRMFNLLNRGFGKFMIIVDRYTCRRHKIIGGIIKNL